jgi:hypothetical protein
MYSCGVYRLAGLNERDLGLCSIEGLTGVVGLARLTGLRRHELTRDRTTEVNSHRKKCALRFRTDQGTGLSSTGLKRHDGIAQLRKLSRFAEYLPTRGHAWPRSCSLQDSCIFVSCRSDSHSKIHIDVCNAYFSRWQSKACQGNVRFRGYYVTFCSSPIPSSSWPIPAGPCKLSFNALKRDQAVCKSYITKGIVVSIAMPGQHNLACFHRAYVPSFLTPMHEHRLLCVPTLF